MSRKIKKFVVIGSSRGLGEAIVEEILESPDTYVFGVARTPLRDLPSCLRWSESNRYYHFELDIGNDAVQERLAEVCERLPNEAVCVILNAAYVESEVDQRGVLDYSIVREINQVGIDGVIKVVECFEEHLKRHNGVMVGVSSFSVYTPIAIEPMLAYAASKSYLDSFLRGLGRIWRGKASVLLVHLGRMGGKNRRRFPNFLVPTYQNVARMIIAQSNRTQGYREINYPIIYSVIYRYGLKMIPNKIFEMMNRSVFRKK